MQRESGRPPRLPGVVDGKFHVLAHLEASPETVRYVAEHTAIRREVELHTLAEGVAVRGPAAARLLRAARASGSTSHLALQSVVDSGTDRDGRPYFVYEAVRGKTVTQLLAEGTRFDVVRAGRIILTVLEALRALHRAGVIVRGLGPENVVVAERSGDEDSVKLCRLERAAFLAEDAPDDAIPFTPYVAPEIRRGGSGLDVRADVYSAGVLLRHLLSGRTQSNAPLPDTARRAVDRATASEPDERFPDVEIFMQAVALLVPGEGRPSREEMPTPQDPLAADLHYLNLRRSTRHGTKAARGEARVKFLPVLLTIEAVYRALGPARWAKLADECPGVEDLLPGAGHTSDHFQRGVPVELFAAMLAAADRTAGRGDMSYLPEVGDAVAQRGLARLLPNLPTPLQPEALIDGWAYVWGAITQQGSASTLERRDGFARLAVRGQAEPTLELTGFVAGLLRAAMRTAGAGDPEVLVSACQARGDVADIYQVSYRAR